MAESPDPGGGESWWSSFGEQYDDAAAAAAAKDSEGSVEPSALEVQLREDHAAANARLLTQLRAKSQLLELETEAKNRLAAQLAAAVANGATREHTLSKEVQQERMATEVLRDQIAALEMEVERRVSSTERSAAGEATRARVDAATEERMRQATAIEQRQRGLEKQVESMREQLLELRRTEMAERDAMKALRQAAEREALDAERNTRRRLHEDGTRQREQYQLLREAAASDAGPTDRPGDLTHSPALFVSNFGYNAARERSARALRARSSAPLFTPRVKCCAKTYPSHT